MNQPRRHPSARAAFRAQPVALACALMLLGAEAVQAQQASQEVVVTGIRRAIETAVAAKRSSDSIVEVVSSEDLGKLPEQSVAESLARLPGVTGQRGASGRTDFISIRGLAPKFGGVVMNGREMVSSNDGRAVEFDQFPSELVNQLVVYKTPDAALVGQGLSGTVDIRTLKPLDLRNRQVSINLNGATNSNNTPVAGGGSTTGKRVSMSYVDQFADRTIGVSLGYAHLDSPAQTISNRINEYVNPYNNGACIPTTKESWCPIPAVGLPLQKNGGGLAKQDYAAFPQRFEVFAESKSNVRDGLMATLEYRPNKDLRSQLDLFYSKFDSRTVTSGFQAELYNGIWSGDATERPTFSNVTTQQAGGNTIVTAGTMGQISNAAINNTSSRTDKTSAIGWNTAYKLDKDWTLVSDLSYSANKRNEAFYENYAALWNNGKFTRGAFNFVAPGTDPNVLMQITPAGQTDLTNTGTMRVGDPFGYVGGSAESGWAGPIRMPQTDDKIKSLRFSGKRNLEGVFSGVEAGFNYTQRDKTLAKNQYDLYLKKDAAGNFINTVPSAFLRTPVDLSTYGVPPVISIDAEALAKSGFFTTKQALWLTTTSDSSVHEKVATGYVKLDIDTELRGLPLRGNVGLQAVHTKQNSTGWSWLGGANQDSVTNLREVTGGAAYTDYLPSLNLMLDLKNDVMVRLGLARTLVRPEMNDMRAGTSAKLSPATSGATSGPATWSSDASGNPELQPWRANSYDLSLEKYLGKQSYLAAAVYRKQLVSNIYVQDVVRDFTNVPHDPALVPIKNLVVVKAPANGNGGYVEGVEFSAALEGKLVANALDGFGLVASASKVRSSIHAQNDPSQPLEGLSGYTTSVTLFYEKNGFSARVNETHRSPFLAQSRNWDYTTTYTKTSADNVVNMQLGYAFDSGWYKGLSLTLQVLNVTDSALVTQKSVGAQGFNPDPAALVPYEVRKFGRQVGLGVGYKF
jgi:TonB-dependent receptor